MLDPQFIKVQELEPVDALADADELPIGQGAAELNKVALAELKAWLFAALPALRDGDDGRTVLHGDGPPVAELGVDGDFYLSSTQTLYGPKLDGAWPAGTALRGLSAYEIAVEHGFAGTEQEWIDQVSAGGAGYADAAAQSASDAAAARDSAIAARDLAQGYSNTAEAARDDAIAARDAAIDAANGPFAIADVDGLQGELDGKADDADVTAVSAALAGKVDSSSVGQADGVAALGADGKVPALQLPTRAIDDVDGLQGALDGKADDADLNALADTVAGKADAAAVNAALANKVDVSSVGAADGVAALGADGKVPAGQLPAAAEITIADVTNLQGALDGKADDADIVAVNDELATKVDQASVGAANGVASLGADGKVPAGQLPASTGGSTDWGAIGGTLADQADLAAALDAKADDAAVTAALAGKEPTIAAGTAAQYYRGDKSWQALDKAAVGLGNVDNTADADKPVSTAQQQALNGKLDSSLKGAANGVASLDASGKVPAAQIPPIAITETFVVNSEAAMLGLAADEGDVAVRTDLGKSFIHNGGTAGTIADWQELLSPTDAVVSVAGKTGAVVLVKADVGLDQVDNTADVDKPVSTAQQAAIDAVDKAAVGLDQVDNTSDADKPVSTAQQAALDAKAPAAPQVQAVASAATVTPTFADDAVNITAQAAALTLANWTGTAVDFWGLVVRIKDNGTARAIGYGTNYQAADGVTLPATTTVGKTLELAIEHNAQTGKHVVISALTY
jgi:hypothetical protein